MIRRLKELTPRDFRCYRSQEPISLDADVVVIYGSNGSGKTSLFSAIEYALTGSVAHLETYDSDYPRCLRHIRATDETSVSLVFQSPDAQPRIVRSLKNSDKPLVGNNLSASDIQFYRERCYLSQNQLSRMFDSYSDGIKRDQDQPLVRFARELLSLDSLENITDGLHVALDLRRLDKASSRFRELRAELEGMAQKRSAILEEVAEKKAAFRLAVTVLEDLFRERHGPHALVQWNEPTLISQRQLIENEQTHTNRQSRVNALQRYSGSLATATRLLESVTDHTGDSKDFLLSQLKATEGEQTMVRLSLSPAVQRLETLLSAHFPSQLRQIRSSTFEQRLVDLETTANHSLQTIEVRLAEVAQAQTQRDDLERRQAELHNRVEATVGASPSEVSRVQEWLQTLTALSRHLDGDRCPVCARDYAEVQSGTLKQKLEFEIDRLGGNVRTLNERADIRAQQQEELAQLSGSIAALTQRITRDEEALTSLADSVAELRALAGCGKSKSRGLVL
jgi:DNA repair protein SbcC/Rad50